MNGMVKIAETTAKQRLRREALARRVAAGALVGPVSNIRSPASGALAGAGLGLAYHATLGRLIDDAIDEQDAEAVLREARAVQLAGAAGGGLLTAGAGLGVGVPVLGGVVGGGLGLAAGSVGAELNAARRAAFGGARKVANLDARDRMRREAMVRRVGGGALLLSAPGAKWGVPSYVPAVGAASGLLYHATLGRMIDDAVREEDLEAALSQDRAALLGVGAGGAALGAAARSPAAVVAGGALGTMAGGVGAELNAIRRAATGRL